MTTALHAKNRLLLRVICQNLLDELVISVAAQELDVTIGKHDVTAFSTMIALRFVHQRGIRWDCTTYRVRNYDEI